MISYILKNRINKNRNTLILDKIYFLEFIKNLKSKNFLNKYFYSIKIISTQETKNKIVLLNYFKLYFYTNKIIKKIDNRKDLKKILNLDYKNFYGSGTYLDVNFYGKNYKTANYYFVEHGIGNIVNFAFTNIIKLKIYFLLIKILDFLFFNKTINYAGYIGIINKNFPKKIYINNIKIKKNLFVGASIVKKVFLEIIYNFKFINLKKNKNYILFNWDFTIKPTLSILEDIFKDHNIDFNKNILVIKMHTNKSYRNLKNAKHLINIFKRKKIKYLLIPDNIIFLPVESFVLYMNIKKIISLMSSASFYLSIIDRKIKNNIYFSLNKKFNRIYLSKEHSIKYLNFYKKSFSNISFY
jgi:hypothetical protein